MKKKKALYILWGFLFILCAGLGFIPEASGFGKAVLVFLGLAFFAPGAILLWDAVSCGDRKTVRRIRLLSLCWLVVTLVLLVGNLLSVGASQGVGNVLYGLLVVLSAPMVFGQFWEMSIFLWACLLTASFLRRKS